MEQTLPRIWRAWLCLCALLLVWSGTAAAQDLRVSARMSSGVIKLGSDARLIIEVRDAQAAGLGDLPKVEGLSIGPLGPSITGRTTEIANGRTKTSVQHTWSVPVTATQTGRYTIPPLEVRADGKATFTKPVQFEVVKDVEGEDFGWFTMDAPREVYAGQPFTLDLVVGFDKSLGVNVNYANITLPWYGALSGLVELPTPDAGQRAANQINLNGDQIISVESGGERERDGRTYTTLRWRKRYLASDPGVLELSTSHFEFGQIARSFFGFDPSQKKTMYKRLEPVSIRVLPVPEAGTTMSSALAPSFNAFGVLLLARGVSVENTLAFALALSGFTDFKNRSIAYRPVRISSMKSWLSSSVYDTPWREIDVTL